MGKKRDTDAYRTIAQTSGTYDIRQFLPLLPFWKSMYIQICKGIVFLEMTTMRRSFPCLSSTESRGQIAEYIEMLFHHGF